MFSLTTRLKQWMLKETDELEQLLHTYADEIEAETITIERFSNKWNRLYFTNSLFNSTQEIEMLSQAVNDLLELHFEFIPFSNIQFAEELRRVLFQYGYRTY